MKSDRDLDAKVDALLARAAARAPSSPDDDERAAAILRAALAAGPLEGGDPTGAPDLPPEPGEPGPAHATSRASGLPGATSQNGSSMSDETPKPPASRRPSLKELAESVKNRPSQTGPDSQPASAKAPPSLKDTLVALDGKTPPPPPSSYDSPPSSQVPPSGVPASAPAASGRGSAPPASGPASGPVSAPPGSAATSARPVGVAPAAAPSNPHSVPSTKPSAGVSKVPAKQGSSVGLGVGIAALGLAAAAAFALWGRGQPAPPAEVAAVSTAAPEAEASPKAAPEGKAAAKPEGGEATPPEGVIDINQLADATSSAAPVGGPLVGGPLPSGSPAASAVASKDGPAKPAGPGEELDEAIRNRAGGGSEESGDAEPAAEAGGRKNVPDVPATGAVTSAINAVKGNAKGCVAGADEPSSATITFGSAGTVQSVTVGGWAQGKSAASCIKSALSGARVPPFAKPTYSTSVTIRP